MAFKIQTDPHVGRLTYVRFTLVVWSLVVMFIILQLMKKSELAAVVDAC